MFMTLAIKILHSFWATLHSAFPNYDQSASHCITPVKGFRNKSALRVHFLHFLGSIPASHHFTGAHNANSTTIP